MSCFPTVIDLELSNRCNLACVMCPRLPQNAHSGAMRVELLDRLLDEAFRFPSRIFRLHGSGEPLLAPTFEHAVNRITTAPGEHAVHLVTNGHLLDRSMARFLLSHAVPQVTVSLGAATRETYEKVRSSTHFDEVVKNVIHFIDERDRRGSPTVIGVQLVRVPPADAEAEAFVAFWSRFDVVVEIWHDVNWGRRALDAPVTLDLPACERLWDSTVVCWDGRVALCCIDCYRLHVVGNVQNATLHQVYNGPSLEDIRDRHRRHATERLPLCVDCSFRDGNHIAFSANVKQTGARLGPLFPVPKLPPIG
ncbi:MAG: radical SAM protein [Deltaproteobacteria bacterium]|nr:radical SAM protein [Deltaproteobacteria bacterium]